MVFESSSLKLSKLLKADWGKFAILFTKVKFSFLFYSNSNRLLMGYKFINYF